MASFYDEPATHQLFSAPRGTPACTCASANHARAPSRAGPAGTAGPVRQIGPGSKPAAPGWRRKGTPGSRRIGLGLPQQPSGGRTSPTCPPVPKNPALWHTTTPHVFGSERQTAKVCVCGLMLRRRGNLCFSPKNAIFGALSASDRQDLGGLMAAWISRSKTRFRHPPPRRAKGRIGPGSEPARCPGGWQRQGRQGCPGPGTRGPVRARHPVLNQARDGVSAIVARPSAVTRYRMTMWSPYAGKLPSSDWV
jgi:hypothetical protein